MPVENNRPKGENSPNPVTLAANDNIFLHRQNRGNCKIQSFLKLVSGKQKRELEQ
jgi:hypothetical protein